MAMHMVRDCRAADGIGWQVRVDSETSTATQWEKADDAVLEHADRKLAD
jgi:hypothetical protein